MIADAVQMSKVGRNTSSGEEVNIPEPYACAEWEWKEDSEDMGMSAVYDQVLITIYYSLLCYILSISLITSANLGF